MARKDLLVLGKARTRETMSDITKCTGEGCAMKERCHRFTDPTNPLYQSFFVSPPIKNGKCQMYWGKPQKKVKDED